MTNSAGFCLNMRPSSADGDLGKTPNITHKAAMFPVSLNPATQHKPAADCEQHTALALTTKPSSHLIYEHEPTSRPAPRLV